MSRRLGFDRRPIARASSPAGTALGEDMIRAIRAIRGPWLQWSDGLAWSNKRSSLTNPSCPFRVHDSRACYKPLRHVLLSVGEKAARLLGIISLLNIGQRDWSEGRINSCPTTARSPEQTQTRLSLEPRCWVPILCALDEVDLPDTQGKDIYTTLCSVSAGYPANEQS